MATAIPHIENAFPVGAAGNWAAFVVATRTGGADAFRFDLP
jgi:hypothetical protein